MKTSSVHFLAAAALAGLVTGCATKPAATCSGKPAASCSAKSSCPAKGSCSAKGGCGGSTPKKSSN